MIIIEYYTFIEEVAEDISDPPTKEFNVVPLHNISELTSPALYIDIVGIVLGISQEQKRKRKRKRDSMEISFREIMLTDTNRQITPLMAWADFIDNACGTLYLQLQGTLYMQLQDKPVVVITNIRLKDLYGHTTIGTTQSSEILINPNIPEAKQLETWKLENANYLQNMWSNNGSTSEIQLTTIKEISEAPNAEQAYNINAFITSILPQEQCWYMSCNICHRKTYEPMGTIFTCGNCQQENVTAEPWCSVRVEVGDTTGNMPATLFGSHAEKALACDTKLLVNLEIEEELQLLEKWSAEETTTEFIFHAKVTQLRNTLRLNIIDVEIV